MHSIAKLKTLDLSKNALRSLDRRIAELPLLKSLNLQGNQLPKGSVQAVAQLSNLQILNLGNNQLGRMVVAPVTPTNGSKKNHPTPAKTATATSKNVPHIATKLPASLKQLILPGNQLSVVPPVIVSSSLLKLERLDLSHNQLACLPVGISKLSNLTSLLLDHNVIVSLPEELGRLTQLKVMSLKQNQLRASDRPEEQPLPRSLFADTPVIDLNLHGNPLTSTQLNNMDGFDVFLERRQKVKTTTLTGGALTDLDVCGLK